MKVGDLVRLKSGGSLMTIEEIVDNDYVNCIWMNDKKEIVRDCFLLAIIEKDNGVPIF